ncbi:uncharacterized protein [Diadema setosum]|uniref:uncharacterized protein n=1 Tax=Diadema setosum TaxID=31175 RepID=UPI003B3AD61A
MNDKQGLLRLMRNEGYDLSKFELVAIPEAFSDASDCDQIGHSGLLEYDGILEEECDGEDSECYMSEANATEEFNVTIEHVGEDIGQETNDIHLLDVEEQHGSTRQFCKEDILDIGIEASDLNSLLEQFEESESPKKVAEAPPAVCTDLPQGKEPKVSRDPRPFRNPEDVIKKIAPVKRKAAILLETQALPLKRTKAKAAVEGRKLSDTPNVSHVPQAKGPVKPSPQAEIQKAIHLARSNTSSPIPFNLKALIPAPKYLSMEHDYCLSPAASEKSSASDVGSHMSKEERRAYYKNKYRVKKKLQGYESPSLSPSVSSSPASMSPASGSPNSHQEEANEQAPAAKSLCPNPVPLFDKIPAYFSKKLLVGMYKEIDQDNPNKPVHQAFDQSIFVMNNNTEVKENMHAGQDGERNSQSHFRRRRRSSLRRSKPRRNSLSSQSDCSSCSDDSYRKSDGHSSPLNSGSQSWGRRRRRRTRSSMCSAASRSRSRSRSSSRSLSRSSYSSPDSRWRSRSRSFSRSRSRSRSYSRSRSRSYSRSRSRSRSRSYSQSPRYSRSRSRSFSRSRSRSLSKSRKYSRHTRSYSRSPSRSPSRTRSSVSHRRSLSRARSERSKSRSRRKSGRSESRSRNRHALGPSFDPNEVKYTEEQLQEFAERRVVYVGNIDAETKKIDLYQQFSKFGTVEKVTLHFREDQDSYGFVTFRYKCDAVAAIAAGNDPHGPQYDLCFGGRRKFCKTKYEDLDSLTKASEELKFGYHGNAKAMEPAAEESEFDKLLKAAMKNTKR